eukprot:471573-Pyramimonas_sp.AAC.1
MPANQVEYIMGMGWGEHRIRHWYFLRQCKRDDEGNIIRSLAGQTKSREEMVERDLKWPSSRTESSTEAFAVHAPLMLITGSAAPSDAHEEARSSK